MEFQLPISFPSLPQPIRYGEKILLTGSCFTEHIGEALSDWKFSTLLNPNGILFDAASVASSLISYIGPKRYMAEDLVFFNELWQSWQHHSHFSGTNKAAVLEGINASQERAHAFLREANWLIITLGSAFSYRLASAPGSTHGAGELGAVANCHRAPGQHFVKHLLTIEEIVTALDSCLHQLFYFNPGLTDWLSCSQLAGQIKFRTTSRTSSRALRFVPPKLKLGQAGIRTVILGAWAVM